MKWIFVVIYLEKKESYFRSLFGVSGQNFPAGMVGSVFILPHLEFTQNQWDIVGKNALKY